jgi:hypothetical protein
VPTDLPNLRREADLLLHEWNNGMWIPHPESYGDDVRGNPGAVAQQCLELIDEMEQARAEMHHLMHHFGAMRIQIKDMEGRETFNGTLAEWLTRESADA